jgi:hypothetical protein
MRQKATLLGLVLHLFHLLPLSQSFIRPFSTVAPLYKYETRHETDFIRRWSNHGNDDENVEQQKSFHFLILPGFFNDSQDYTMPGSLFSCLTSRISPDRIHVLPVQRMDWLTVFLCGVIDINFWTSNMAPTRPAFSWYLERIFKEVNRIKAEQVVMGIREENVKVVLLGHSAGSWLARAAVGFGTNTTPHTESKSLWEKKIALQHIAGFVSLGTPHIPPPESVMDMTRGALRITNEYFPGAYHAPDGLFYVTVIGNAVSGREQKKVSSLQPRTIDEVAYVSYEAVCGNGNTIGDGVVPINSAHLNDAIQVELSNVFHSMSAPEDWYGSEKIIDQWLTVVLEQLEN